MAHIGFESVPRWSCEMTTPRPARLNRFAGWSCDCCGLLITRVEDGWVEWLAPKRDGRDGFFTGLRIVHRVSAAGGCGTPGCRYDACAEFQRSRSTVEGLALENLVGPDGLMTLLSFLAVREFRTADIVDLTKRIQIPGYELVRNLYGDLDRVMPPSILGEGCYLQFEMRNLLAHAANEQPLAAL